MAFDHNKPGDRSPEDRGKVPRTDSPSAGEDLSPLDLLFFSDPSFWLLNRDEEPPATLLDLPDSLAPGSELPPAEVAQLPEGDVCPGASEKKEANLEEAPGQNTVTTLFQPQECLLTVRQISPVSRGFGKPFSYGALVSNHGEVSAFQVRLEHALAQDTQLIDCHPLAMMEGRLLIWDLGQLDPGAEQRIEVQVEVAHPGRTLARVSPRFRVACKRPPIPLPKLVLAVTYRESAVVGERTSIRLQITNEGSRPAHQLTVRHRLPAGLRHSRGQEFEFAHPVLAARKTLQITLKATAVEAGEQIYRSSITTAEGWHAAIQVVIQAVRRS